MAWKVKQRTGIREYETMYFRDFPENRSIPAVYI